MTISYSSLPWHKNIFLDFLNPDVRRVAGAYSKFNQKRHIQEILHAIKIACLLGDKLILPPSFILQCPIVREALNRCQILLKTKTILFPMRESDPNVFYEKKTTQYKSVRNFYNDIHQNFGFELIKKHPNLFIQRRTNIGKTISNFWFDSNLPTIKWELLQEKLPHKYDSLRELPRRLVENNIAVTAPAIQELADSKALNARDEIDLILQGIYGIIYLNEFEAAIVTNLPIQPWDFGLPKNKAYNYLIFKDTLIILDIFSRLINMNFNEIYLLRNRNGYLRFLKSYILLSNGLSKDDLLLTFSDAVRNKKTKIKKILEHISGEFIKFNLFISSKIEALDDFFFEISDYIHTQYPYIFQFNNFSKENYHLTNYSETLNLTGGQSVYSISKKQIKQHIDIIQNKNKGDIMRVMIFSALEEELSYLRKDFNLTMRISSYFKWEHYTKDLYYKSTFKLESGEEIEVFLVTPDEAGLVPTAILASHIKSIIQPDLSIMIGICGGRFSEGIRLGDIIMPYQSFLYHYGAYKDEKLIPEIRLEKIEKQISSWASNILNDNLLTKFFNLFPDGSNKPRTISKIRKEPMGCGDLVVKDISIIDGAKELDRKLIGVDMESYSFIRAVGEANKVLVFKAVADYADKEKDDHVRDYCKYLIACCVVALINNIHSAPITK